jgi:hypothetical protein
MGLVLTTHAAQRYQERVKPALDIDICRQELTALAAASPIQTDAPWERWPADIEPPSIPPPDGYIELAPSIWAVVAIDGDKVTLLTVLVNRSLSSPRRQKRNEAKAAQRRDRQRRRQGYLFMQGKRRHRLEPWK